MSFQENLTREIERQGIKEEQLAKRSGIAQATVNRIKSGSIRNPGLDKVIALAKGLRISPGRLLDDNAVTEPPSNYQNTQCFYPRVVGTARCGDDGYYTDLEGGDGYIEFDAVPGSIAIRIKGHSMHPAIREGWYVIIEPNKQPDIGEYVLAKFKDGKKMVKELLQIKPDGYLLLSVNGNERITANFEELEGVEAITAIVPPSKHKEW